jgi:hypothetical protein
MTGRPVVVITDLCEQLRADVLSCPGGVWSVSRGSGVPWTTLKAFTRGRGITLRTAERLLRHFGYHRLTGYVPGSAFSPTIR